MYLRKISRVKILFVTLIFLLGILFTGCGSSGYRDEATSEAKQYSEKDSGYRGGDAYGGFNEETQSDSSNKDTNNRDKTSQKQNALGGRKIIKSANIELETKTFDATTDEIVRRTDVAGGYIENSNITGTRINSNGNVENRVASFRLRIPSNMFKNFIQDFGNLGNIIVDSRNGEDITDRYFDTEARVKTLKIQEDRLLEILRKAEKVEDIIELERELSDVRYKIENFTGTLQKWDNLVSYATLSVRVYEVQEVKEIKIKPVTFGEKVKNGFVESVESLIDICKGLVILIVSSIPFLVLLIPGILTIIYILKKYSYKNKNDNNDK